MKAIYRRIYIISQTSIYTDVSLGVHHFRPEHLMPMTKRSISLTANRPSEWKWSGNVPLLWHTEQSWVQTIDEWAAKWWLVECVGEWVSEWLLYTYVCLCVWIYEFKCLLKFMYVLVKRLSCCLCGKLFTWLHLNLRARFRLLFAHNRQTSTNMHTYLYKHTWRAEQ